MSSPKSPFYHNSRPFPSLKPAPRPRVRPRLPVSAVLGALVTGCAAGPINLGSVIPAIGSPQGPGLAAPGGGPAAGGGTGDGRGGGGAPDVGRPALPTPPPPKPPVPPKRDPDLIETPPDGAPEPVPLKPPSPSPTPVPGYPGYPGYPYPIQPGSSGFLPDQALRVLELTNGARAASGLDALAGDPTLDGLARSRSEDMGDRNYFSHYTPENTSIFDMLPALGIPYRSAGENIALNSATTAQTATLAFDGWMNSSGHKANILRSTFGRLGVGVYRTSAGKTYLTQVFTD